VIGSRPPTTATVVVFRPHLWADEGFQCLFEAQVEGFLPLFWKRWQFSLTFLKNVVDLYPRSLCEGVLCDEVVYILPPWRLGLVDNRPLTSLDVVDYQPLRRSLSKKW